MAWFDRSTTKKLYASDLCDAIFGADAAASSFREKLNRPSLPPPPRKPHVVQAQRSAALAGGNSCCNLACPPRLPARAHEDCHGAPERRQQMGGNKVAWNWQGRRGSSAAEGGTRKKGGGDADKGQHGKLGGGGGGSRGGPVRFGGVLQAGGEAVVAEKARIEKRLKDIQRERALLLRAKNGPGKCWEERGRRAEPSIPHTNECRG